MPKLLCFLIGMFCGTVLQITIDQNKTQPTSAKVALFERIDAIPKADSKTIEQLYSELQIREGFVDSLYSHLDSYRKPKDTTIYHKWHYYAFYGHMIDSLYYVNYHKTWRTTKPIADSVLRKDIMDRYWYCRTEDQLTYLNRVYNLFTKGTEY